MIDGDHMADNQREAVRHRLETCGKRLAACDKLKPPASGTNCVNDLI
jgi:hypothetical protein